MLGLVEVLQPVTAQVADGDSLGQARAHENPRGVGEKDLSTVSGGGDPRRSVYVDPNVVTTADGTFPRVHAHPDPERPSVRPRFGGEAPLRCHRCADRRRRRAEYDKE
jgi:hypothetical protein